MEQQHPEQRMMSYCRCVRRYLSFSVPLFVLVAGDRTHGRVAHSASHAVRPPRVCFKHGGWVLKSFFFLETTEITLV